MQPTPRLSGIDLARGLIRMGHRMTGNTNGYLLLERGTRAVTVPLLDELQPPLLHFLLLGAGVSLSQLVAALQRPSDPPRSASFGTLPSSREAGHLRSA
jgi:hypothetical protein